MDTYQIPEFHPVVFHVYRQDHTGRGIPFNDAPIPTVEFAHAVEMLARAQERRRVYYVVGEDDRGQRRAIFERRG